jgi:Na+/citrate or Na+/malate symporter
VASIEVAIDILIAIVVVSLLAIRRRARIRSRPKSIPVVYATGVILGLMSVLIVGAVITTAVRSPA